MWIRWLSKHKGCSTPNHKPNFDPAAEELITAHMDTFLNKTQSNDSSEPSRLVKLQTVKPPINIFRIILKPAMVWLEVQVLATIRPPD